jgi:hypothetical protein
MRDSVREKKVQKRYDEEFKRQAVGAGHSQRQNPGADRPGTGVSEYRLTLSGLGERHHPLPLEIVPFNPGSSKSTIAHSSGSRTNALRNALEPLRWLSKVEKHLGNSFATERNFAVMGLFTNLMSKIFRHATAAPSTTIEAATSPTPTTPGASAVSSGASSASEKSVDVTAIPDDLAVKNPEKLDWRKSIVDLMKLVEMDSGLSARKQLARELHYSGDESDSAAMNVWLHKQVVTKLAENGGSVPPELLG